MKYFTQTATLTSISCAVALAIGSTSASAIEITSTNSAEDLANTLIIPNSGVTITSYSLLGGVMVGGEGPAPVECDDEVECDVQLPIDPCIDNVECEGPILASISTLAADTLITPQSGTFTNTSDVYGLPVAGGVVFSTGDVNNYEDGPNTSGSFSGSFNSSATDEQNAILEGITGQTEHYDPVELNITFDVAEDVEQISFIAAFGSEEFPNFVGTEFIDGFGMFVNGTNVAGALETGAEPGTSPLAININHPDFSAIQGTELNGVLAPNGIPLMRFDVPVVPGSEGNTFKLILADAGDSSFDSTIFLSSFGDFDSDGGDSEFTPVLPDPSNPTNDEGAFVIQLPEVEAGETIWFDPDVATGYTYTATDGGLFASVTAPTLLTVNDPNGYLVTYVNSLGDTVEMALMANSTVQFDIPVSTFTITGIDTDLMLSPSDGGAFVTGVSFSEAGQFGVLQLPITTFVPGPTDVSSPGALALFGLGLLGLAGLRKSKKA
ncbi:choice-of-anchor L domain-containing protein [Glaciecola sp. 2405UD65-10]|uniref:choice-of-anchor L domain-containing protein n=1 Tax=Glaciecola sp. 2405UD65-10 TaxID=3397244 RepID=UPI003B5B855D